MSAGINLGNLEFETFAVGFNNIFAGLNVIVLLICPVIISINLYVKIGVLKGEIKL